MAVDNSKDLRFRWGSAYTDTCIHTDIHTQTHTDTHTHTHTVEDNEQVYNKHIHFSKCPISTYLNTVTATS